jgi:hypothetical protein
MIARKRNEQKYKNRLLKIQEKVAYHNGLKLDSNAKYEIFETSVKGNKGLITLQYKYSDSYVARAAFGYLRRTEFCSVKIDARIEIDLDNLNNNLKLLGGNNCYRNVQDAINDKSFYENLRSIATIVVAAGLVNSVTDMANASPSYDSTSNNSFSGNSSTNYTEKKNTKRVIGIKFISNNRDVSKGTLCSRSANNYKIEFSDNSSDYIYQITEREAGCLGNLNDWIYKKSSWGAGMVAKTKDALIEKINKYYE